MITNNLTFSAKKVQDYIDCQRRYELRYLLNQSCPAISSEPILEIESNIKKGSEFHFLIHQYLSNIPEEILKRTILDDSMKEWFENFLSFYKILEVKSIFSEFRLNAKIEVSRFTAVYDVIYLTENEEIGIIDWKTSKYIPNKKNLASKIQSVLYPFILHEGSAEFLPGFNYPPENISMRYWFPHSPFEEIIFPYGLETHEKNRDFLRSITCEIQEKKLGDFVLTEDEKKCGFCLYRSLCNRGVKARSYLESESYVYDFSDFSPDFNLLPEITFDI